MDDWDRLADWQKGKLADQSRRFSRGKLIDLYHLLLEIDHGQKSGQADYDLTKTLELFLTEI